ncbi:D-alanyl-D-alanine carboxypeptidase DacF [Clostridiales bacterium]|nr:D-alanyl-D-alanine carboxypeptidase DacF [Clostridiales bacterium]
MIKKKKMALVLISVILLAAGSIGLSVRSAALEDPTVSNAKGIYLYNLENNKAVFTQNAEEQVYPTSTVKIMTGILAIENLSERLDENITVTSSMLSAVSGNNIGLAAGEIVTIDSMIRALLVNGANDAAYVLAHTVSGSTEEFVTLMNTKAKELGAHHTHYTNPTGMHDENMYTTAEDTAQIAKYAYGLDLFMEATSSVRYSMPATNTSAARTLHNRNCLLSVYYDKNYYNDQARGMNAGSTPQGGHCVVTAATDGELTYIAVVMGAETINGQIYSYINITNLLKWAFDSFTYTQVLSPEQIVCEIPVTLSTAVDYVTLVSTDTLRVYLPADVNVEEEIEISYSTNSKELQAPVYEGQVVGSVTAIYQGNILGTSQLVATTDVTRNDLLYGLYKIEQFTKSRFFIITLIAAVIFTLIYIFGTAILRQKKGKKRMRF